MENSAVSSTTAFTRDASALKHLRDELGFYLATPYKSASVEVDIADGNLTLEVGQMDEYTMLNYLSVEPID